MNFWIFKCNPTHYDFDKRMEDCEPKTTWQITRYADEIHSGDLAFIWKTGKDRGIYAVMAIDENPKEMEEFEHENRYNIPPDYGVKLRVAGRFVKRIKGIPSAELKDMKQLEQLSVFHGFQQGTNFKVTAEEGRIIMALVESSCPR